MKTTTVEVAHLFFRLDRSQGDDMHDWFVEGWGNRDAGEHDGGVWVARVVDQGDGG